MGEESGPRRNPCFTDCIYRSLLLRTGYGISRSLVVVVVVFASSLRRISVAGKSDTIPPISQGLRLVNKISKNK